MTKLSLSAFPDGATWIVEVRSVNDVGGYEQTLEGIPGASADEAIHWVIRHIREELANLGGSLVIEDEASESAGGDDA